MSKGRDDRPLDAVTVLVTLVASVAIGLWVSDRGSPVWQAVLPMAIVWLVFSSMSAIARARARSRGELTD